MTHTRRLMLLVAVMAGLALAGLWWQGEKARSQLRAQAFASAHQRSLQLADAMAGQVDGLLASVDAALLRLRREWVVHDDGTDFDAQVREVLDALPDGMADYISVVDASGHVVYNSLGVATGTYVGDRPHFVVQREGGDRLRVGEPVQSRLTGHWVFVVSRPVLRDGVFDGTVHLLASTAFLSSRLAALTLSPVDIVSLVHRDGRLLAHNTQNEKAMSQRVAADRIYMADRETPSGTYRFESEFDGRWRTAGWRRLPVSGIVTVVGLADDGVLAPLEPALQRSRVRDVVLSGLTLLGAGVVIVLLGRMGRSQQALERLTGELEQRVDLRTHELALLNAELETFAYSIAHDLRTPLRSIHGYASLLEETCAESVGEAGRTHLRRIQAAARRMGQLITDLLSLTQSSRADLNVAAVDLSAMARDIVAELMQGEPGRRAHWHIDQDMQVQADPVLMRAVLQNLLGNAWKYSGQRDEARITFTRESAADGLQTFCVRDNGAGFDMAFAEQLFQPFRRLHANDQFEGSGVGLATVRRIIERHGGTVSGEGRVGEGAAFRFSLPQAGR
ncbi:MAG: ATP-binding protein [Burkholderiaceae bacterium]